MTKHVIAEAATTQPTAADQWRGPCADDPAGWDLDAGDLIKWLRALRECGKCPVLQRCLQLRAEHWPQADPRRPVMNPKSVIWAGVAYSDTGRVMSEDSLRYMAARRRRTPSQGQNSEESAGVAPLHQAS